MREADYISMIDENGVPRIIDMATVRRKIRSSAKQKAPGLTGNGPDLYAAQPGSWMEWTVVLFNVIQHTQVTPRGWHLDHVHYVHKGDNDGSLGNHRPLALIEVLRKVFTGIVIDRMRHDWSRLKVLDECNPGFQAGRTTVNTFLPDRTAAEYCVATKTEMAVLLDDLKWCFDTPANAAIELALMRLGVPAFYVTMLNDMDMHSAKSSPSTSPVTSNARGSIGSCVSAVPVPGHCGSARLYSSCVYGANLLTPHTNPWVYLGLSVSVRSLYPRSNTEALCGPSEAADQSAVSGHSCEYRFSLSVFQPL